MSETHYDDPPDLGRQPSPGELLKRERERQGLSRDEVATALNLRPAVVDGLETDRYDEVPVATYRRGYLRAYSRLLGIDDRPVIEAYNASFGNAETEHKVTPVNVTKPPSRIGAWLFKLVTLLVIAGLIALTLLWWQSREGNDLLGLGGNDPVAVDNMDGTPAEESEQTGEANDSEALPPLPDEDEDMGLVDDPAPESAAEGTPDTSEELVGGRSEEETDDIADAEAIAEVDEPAPEETPLIQGNEILEASPQEAGDEAIVVEEESAAETSETGRLELTFNEQSWTEIFDANNDRIFVGLQEAGSQATAEGDPPFRLTIGNASGVELRYDGEAVDLGARAGSNNVARFTLGE